MLNVVTPITDDLHFYTAFYTHISWDQEEKTALSQVLCG